MSWSKYSKISLLYPLKSIGILCICHRYPLLLPPHRFCVRSTSHSFHPVKFILFKFRSHVSGTKVQMPMCQSILGALRLHLWPLRGQKGFSCGHSRDLSFQAIFFIWTPKMCWTKIQMQIDFWHPVLPFVATRGPNPFVSCVHCKPQSLSDSIHLRGLLVTFV